MVNGLKAIALDENSRNERKADQNDATDNISWKLTSRSYSWENPMNPDN